MSGGLLKGEAARKHPRVAALASSESPHAAPLAAGHSLLPGPSPAVKAASGGAAALAALAAATASLPLAKARGWGPAVGRTEGATTCTLAECSSGDRT